MARDRPGLTQFRGYQREWARGDVVAGVTVAAYLVPQVMAYATVAGLPPIVGLWAILGPLAVYVFIGSSRQLSVGPESSTALMTAVALAPLAAGDPQRYAALAAALALVVGVLCLAGWLARLGVLANLLSRPVLVGYMAGIAAIMIAGQLGKVSGVPVEGEEFTEQVVSFAGGIADAHWPTVLLSASVLALLLLAGWAYPRLPWPLVAVLLATLAVSVFSLQNNGIRVVGDIPTGLPAPDVPVVSMADLGALVLPAVGIMIVGFSDNVLTARALASRRGETIDANRELAALGVTNLASGVLRGFPVSCSGSRTVLGNAVGSRTQLYSLVALGAVVLTLLVAGPVLEGFPMAALGALVVYAALRLIDIGEFRRIARFRRSELVLALLTTVTVLGLGILYGVLAAVGLSIMDLLRRLARPHDGVLGYVPGLAGMHNIDDYPDAMPLRGLVVYRYDAPLCFANADDFLHRALAALDASVGKPHWFLLNAEANVELDVTGADALHQLRTELTRRDIVFAMARVKQDLRDQLNAAGLVDAVGDDRIYPTLPTAVAAFTDWYTDHHGRAPERGSVTGKRAAPAP